MENFVNNTEVSFSQLTKKDGWFSRLIFIESIVNPIIMLCTWIFFSARDTEVLVLYGIWMAGGWTISFLLWKKRTRFTITVSTILLWVLFVFRRIVPLLVATLLLIYSLQYDEANNSLINHRIRVLISSIIYIVIALVLNVIWTRNLRQLKQLQP